MCDIIFSLERLNRTRTILAVHSIEKAFEEYKQNNALLVPKNFYC